MSGYLSFFFYTTSMAYSMRVFNAAFTVTMSYIFVSIQHHYLRFHLVKLTTTVAAGTRTLTPASIGTITLTATYAEDDVFIGSSSAASHVVRVAAATIPDTGFPRGRVTSLPARSSSYSMLGSLWPEVATLGVKMPIMRVPLQNGEWDVTWLGSDAGWLQGSAFPTWEGNSVLTGHVWDALNRAGPFHDLNTLKYGDRVIVHAWGSDSIYEVRSVQRVLPSYTSAMLKHEESSWLTLVTCQGYDEDSETYNYRVLVRAVLIEVK